MVAITSSQERDKFLAVDDSVHAAPVLGPFEQRDAHGGGCSGMGTVRGSRGDHGRTECVCMTQTLEGCMSTGCSVLSVVCGARIHSMARYCTEF